MSTLVVSALDLLPVVSLDEIQAEASLQTRIDRKYLLTAEALEAVIAACAESLRILDIAGERSFGYRSTYFDTPDLAAYRAAATGRIGTTAPTNTASSSIPKPNSMTRRLRSCAISPVSARTWSGCGARS